MHGVQHILFPAVVPGMDGHHLGAIGDFYLVYEGAQKEMALGDCDGHAVAVGLKGDQAEAVRDDRDRAAAGVSPLR